MPTTHWETEVAVSTSLYRSSTGHVDTPDFAFDGHTLERSWSGSPVKISWGLVYLDGESTFSSKAFLFFKYLSHCPTV